MTRRSLSFGIALFVIGLVGCGAAPIATPVASPALRLAPSTEFTPTAKPPEAPRVAAVVDAEKVVACVRAAKSALGVSLSYDGRTLRVDSCLAYDGITPPTRTPPITRDQTGFWFEVRGDDGALLYQDGLPGGLLVSRQEGVDASGQLVQTDGPAVRGVEVVLPNLPGASAIEIFDSDALGSRAVLLARIPMR